MRNKPAFWKRLLLGFLFLAFFAGIDFVLRVVLAQQQLSDWSLRAHTDLDNVTAFYMSYVEHAVDWVQAKVQVYRDTNKWPL